MMTITETTETTERRDMVLIVDDAPESLRFLAKMLGSAGFDVLVASSGEEALEVLHHISPDAIVMDVVMPGMDGFETLCRIKQDSGIVPAPVVFMTGLTESEHAVEAFEVGGADYVRKPVDVNELIARLRVHIASSRKVRGSLASLDATGRLMMATDTAGRFLWCTPMAEQSLALLEPGWTQQGGSLPQSLQKPIERLLLTPDMPGTSIRLDMPQGSLELLLIARASENEVLIRLNEINPHADTARLRDKLGLTWREAEVLLWVSYGKPNRVISEILSISPRTVTKHLEQIFDKLGIETRSAAAVIAIRAIEQ